MRILRTRRVRWSIGVGRDVPVRNRRREDLGRNRGRGAGGSTVVKRDLGTLEWVGGRTGGTRPRLSGQRENLSSSSDWVRNRHPDIEDLTMAVCHWGYLQTTHFLVARETIDYHLRLPFPVVPVEKKNETGVTSDGPVPGLENWKLYLVFYFCRVLNPYGFPVD